jgi:hypothetical protein
VLPPVVGDRYTAPEFAGATPITIDTQRDVLDGGPPEVGGTSAVSPRMRPLADAFPEVLTPAANEDVGRCWSRCKRIAVIWGAAG